MSIFLGQTHLYMRVNWRLIGCKCLFWPMGSKLSNTDERSVWTARRLCWKIKLVWSHSMWVTWLVYKLFSWPSFITIWTSMQCTNSHPFFFFFFFFFFTHMQFRISDLNPHFNFKHLFSFDWLLHIILILFYRLFYMNKKGLKSLNQICTIRQSFWAEYYFAIYQKHNI